MLRRRLGLLLPVLALGCSSEARPAAPAADPTPATDAAAPPAGPIAAAYSALERGDFAALPAVIAALDAAVAKDPKDQLNAFYAGVMHLWRMTEGRGDPAYTEFGADTQAAFSDLDAARKLDPTDPHAAGFYGIALVTAGNLVQNPKTIADGAAVL